MPSTVRTVDGPSSLSGECRIRCDDPLGNLDRHGGTDSGQRASGNDPHSTSGTTARKLEYDPGQNKKQKPWAAAAADETEMAGKADTTPPPTVGESEPDGRGREEKP